MKKTAKRTALIVGGLALALSLVIMPRVKGEGQGSWGAKEFRQLCEGQSSWGINTYEPFGRGEGQGSWGIQMPTYFNL